MLFRSICKFRVASMPTHLRILSLCLAFGLLLCLLAVPYPAFAITQGALSCETAPRTLIVNTLSDTEENGCDVGACTAREAFESPFPRYVVPGVAGVVHAEPGKGNVTLGPKQSCITYQGDLNALVVANTRLDLDGASDVHLIEPRFWMGASKKRHNRAPAGCNSWRWGKVGSPLVTCSCPDGDADNDGLCDADAACQPTPRWEYDPGHKCRPCTSGTYHWERTEPNDWKVCSDRHLIDAGFLDDAEIHDGERIWIEKGSFLFGQDETISVGAFSTGSIRRVLVDRTLVAAGHIASALHPGQQAQDQVFGTLVDSAPGGIIQDVEWRGVVWAFLKARCPSIGQGFHAVTDSVIHGCVGGQARLYYQSSYGPSTIDMLNLRCPSGIPCIRVVGQKPGSVYLDDWSKVIDSSDKPIWYAARRTTPHFSGLSAQGFSWTQIVNRVGPTLKLKAEQKIVNAVRAGSDRPLEAMPAAQRCRAKPAISCNYAERYDGTPCTLSTSSPPGYTGGISWARDASDPSQPCIPRDGPAIECRSTGDEWCESPGLGYDDSSLYMP